VRLAVIDLETSGVAAATDRIVEIAIVQVDGGLEEARWSSLVRCGVAVGASERVHGISDAMLADAPTLTSLREEIATRLAGRTLVAHRAAFDLAFLSAAAERGEVDAVSAGVVDTAAIAERTLGESGLASVARRIGGRRPSHRALPDALAALDALAACVETLGPVDAADLARLSLPRASMRRAVEETLRLGLERGEPVGVVYRPSTGRAHEDRVHIERLEPPYVTGTLESKGIRRILRGDRIVRAWIGPRPAMRFLDGTPPTPASVDVGDSRP
jgi:DNA polymerase III epsilon subunit-like protein